MTAPCLAVLALVGPWLPAAQPPDGKAIHGTWKVVSYVVNGKRVPENLVSQVTVTIDEKHFRSAPGILERIALGGGASEWVLDEQDSAPAEIKLNPAAKPPTIDLRPTAGPPVRLQGIYKLDGDRLTLIYSPKSRPTDFTSKPGSGRFLWVMERQGR